MKFIICIISVFFTTGIYAQENRIIGSWEGKINVGASLRIVLHVEKDEKGNYSTKMDSPDQSTFGILTDFTKVTDDSLITRIDKYQVSFAGKFVDDSSITGIFKQSASVPLTLKRSSSKPVKLNRPQEPKEPFPYNIKEVTYSNGQIQLSGTLTSPKIDPEINYVKAPVFPSVILITGSGPQNRDEEVMGHKPFLILADFLTRKGFNVLRVDDRGTGKSTGDFTTATTADFAQDVIAGTNFLKTQDGVDLEKIGLLGHSEGGMIAQLVAENRKDLDFLILLAAPGIKTIDLMTEQNLAILNTRGVNKKAQDAYGDLYKNILLAVINENDSVKSRNAAAKVFSKWIKNKDEIILKELGLNSVQQQESYVQNISESLSAPWFKYFLKYDPAPVLKKLNTKVLALNGDKDIQVLSASNLEGLRAGLKKTKSDSEFHSLPGLNHLFQNCIKCTVLEYGQIEETISPKVLEIISDWLQRKVISQ